MVFFMAIKFALTTEKAVAGIDRQNALVFIVEENATKGDIRKEIESSYKEKVKDIRTLNDTKGRKKAIVVFEKKGAAADLAAKLKVI